MAYLNIEGLDYDPSTLSVGTFELQEAFRNTKGDATVDVINTKRKLNVAWLGITPTLQSTILTATAGSGVSVTYIDPTINATKTINCYRGDVTSGILKVTSGLPALWGLSFNLIEL